MLQGPFYDGEAAWSVSLEFLSKALNHSPNFAEGIFSEVMRTWEPELVNAESNEFGLTRKGFCVRMIEFLDVEQFKETSEMFEFPDPRGGRSFDSESRGLSVGVGKAAGYQTSYLWFGSNRGNAKGILFQGDCKSVLHRNVRVSYPPGSRGGYCFSGDFKSRQCTYGQEVLRSKRGESGRMKKPTF
jgi:hypothetical protein